MKLMEQLRKNSQSGQSMAEFIVVVPVLTLMFYSVLYFGQALVYKGRVAMAARYFTLKEARGFSNKADIYTNFFSDVGSNNVSYSDGTFAWLDVIGLAAYVVPFWNNDQGMESLGLFVNPDVYSFAKTGEVSYSYEAPAYLSFIGNHQHNAGLMVDGNPWAWPTLNFPFMSMEVWLMLYALDNDWTPWWLLPPFVYGFPRWWAITPWFPLPPYPQND